jgi:hypothetical protein
LFWILEKADRRFQKIRKTITIRTVWETRWGVETTLKETEYQIDAQHTLQQAVRKEYPLPGACMTVRLVRRGFNLWDQSEEKKISFQRNLYFEIEHGDIVVIALPSPDDELPPSGPAAHTLDPAKRCPSVTLREMRACLSRIC